MFQGKKWNKWAEVVDLNGFSGHADHEELMRQMKPLAGRAKVRLVHGDVEHATVLAKDLRSTIFEDVSLPVQGEVLCGRICRNTL